LREGGNIVSERGVVDAVGEDPEESGGFVAWIRLQFRVNPDDEGSSDDREQTSEYQGRVQALILSLEEVPAVLFRHFAVRLLIQLNLMVLSSGRYFLLLAIRHRPRDWNLHDFV